MGWGWLRRIRGDYWGQYLRQVGHHWGNLASGGVAAVLGFVADATKFAIPSWVFWAAALVFLTVGQFRAYRDVRRSLDGLEAEALAIERRRQRLLHQRDLANEDFFVWELIEPTARPLIEHRTFTDCVVRGPALVTPQLDVTLNWATFEGVSSIEELLYELPAPGRKQGVFALFDCRFERCKFHQIGWYGDKAFLDRLRAIRTL
ncbi:MAG: hypothetical protein ACYDC5_12480 [Candidatus Dormibacteria bacterium]